MALEEMYDYVFSTDSRQQREMPDMVSDTIKEKITLQKVMVAAFELKNTDGFEELKAFILEWRSHEADPFKVSKKKDMLVKRANKADME